MASFPSKQLEEEQEAEDGWSMISPKLTQDELDCSSVMMESVAAAKNGGAKDTTSTADQQGAPVAYCLRGLSSKQFKFFSIGPGSGQRGEEGRGASSRRQVRRAQGPLYLFVIAATKKMLLVAIGTAGRGRRGEAAQARAAEEGGRRRWGEEY